MPDKLDWIKFMEDLRPILLRDDDEDHDPQAAVCRCVMCEFDRTDNRCVSADPLGEEWF